jgi:16S rRNA (uracil1498-N3)-methyltransferase
MQLFYSPNIQNNTILIEDEEFHHLKVLRKAIGSELAVTDGKGNLFSARILEIAKHHCLAEIENTQHVEPTAHGLHVAVAPTKNIDRIEWLVEKLTEIGVAQISFIQCTHSERKVLKAERLNKIALSAMKQSLQFYLPQLSELQTFTDFITAVPQNTNLFMGYCETENTQHILTQPFTYQNSVILIGPEGDFSPAEVLAAQKAGFMPVSLGTNRLRTETAAMVAAALINAKFEVNP